MKGGGARVRKLLNKVELNVRNQIKSHKNPEVVNVPQPQERSRLPPLRPKMKSPVKKANLTMNMMTTGKGLRAPMIWTNKKRYSRIYRILSLTEYLELSKATSLEYSDIKPSRTS